MEYSRIGRYNKNLSHKKKSVCNRTTIHIQVLMVDRPDTIDEVDKLADEVALA